MGGLNFNLRIIGDRFAFTYVGLLHRSLDLAQPSLAETDLCSKVFSFASLRGRPLCIRRLHPCGLDPRGKLWNQALKAATLRAPPIAAHL